MYLLHQEKVTHDNKKSILKKSRIITNVYDLKHFNQLNCMSLTNRQTGLCIMDTYKTR